MGLQLVDGGIEPLRLVVSLAGYQVKKNYPTLHMYDIADELA